MHALESAESLQRITWGQPEHVFSLTSRDPAVISRGATVFAPWRCNDASSTASVVWTVIPSAPDQWTLATDGQVSVTMRGNARRAITVLESLALQRIFQGPPDTLTLHAALVARGDRGALILGPSESGKSTLSCGLWRRGWSLLGDDVAVIDPLSAIARSAPRRVSLRHPSRALLDATLWEQMLGAPSTEQTDDGYLFHPSEVGHDVPRPVRLEAIVFLRRSGVDVPAAPRRLLHDAETVLALIPYSNFIRRMDAGDAIRLVAPLAGQVPAYDLGRAPLDHMAAALTQILDHAC